MNNKLLLPILIIGILAPAVQAASYIDLIAPEDGTHLSNENVTFDYYPNLEGGVDRCTLEVDGSFPVEDNNVSNSEPNSFKTTSPPEGNYTWRVHCTNVNESVVSDPRILVVDKTTPEITLDSPEDNATVGEEVQLKFTATDNTSGTLVCEAEVDGQQVGSVEATNGTQAQVTASGLSEGAHTWNAECRDKANNSAKSQNRTFTTEIEANFSASLDSQKYDIGDQVILSLDAPDGTNTSLEICPDGEGFVECFESLTLKEAAYPREEVLPFTNKTGKFIVDAFFSYKGQTGSRQLMYEVLNNIKVETSGDTSVLTGMSTTLTGSATGGSGPFKYEWKLHNGTVVEGNKAELEFNKAGSFDETFVARDEAGNEKRKKVTVKVTKSYEATFEVRDAKSNKLLEGATIEVKDDEEVTGEKGKASMRVPKGKHATKAFMTGYQLYEKNIEYDKNKEINIRLQPTRNLTPEVVLEGPESGDRETPGQVEFSFSLKDADEAACSLYIGKGEGSFDEKGSADVSDSSTKTLNAELSNGEYSWKVTCEQGGAEYNSKTRKLTIAETDDEVQTASTGDSSELGFDKRAMTNTLNNVLEGYSSMSTRERTLAEKLGFYDQAKDSLKKVQRAARDIHDLPYRTSLTDEEKENKKKKVVEDVKRAYRDTVINVEIKDSKSFVNYPEKEELMPLIEVYAEKHGYSGDVEGVADAIQALQGEIVVSTRATIMEVERVDGTKKTVTAVVKKVETGEVDRGSYLLEYVPKEMAKTVDEMVILGDYEVVEEDPVLRFELDEGETEVAYYFNRELNLEDSKNTHTIVAKDNLAAELSGVTGSATFMMPEVDVESEGFLVMVIVLLLVIYFLHSSDLWDKVTGLLKSGEREKEVHYVRVLVNDALDNLDAGDYDKASLIYREIKLTFDNMGPGARNEVFEEIMDLVNKLDIAYSRQLSDSIDEAIKKGEYDKARMMYGKLRATYRKLGEKYKKEIYDKVIAIAGRLQ